MAQYILVYARIKSSGLSTGRLLKLDARSEKSARDEVRSIEEKGNGQIFAERLVRIDARGKETDVSLR